MRNHRIARKRIGEVFMDGDVGVIVMDLKEYHIAAELLEGLLDEWSEWIVMKNTEGC